MCGGTECRTIGRNFDDIELSGMVYVVMGRTEAEAEMVTVATGHMLGLPDLDAVRRSPNVLVGTPDLCVAELQRRARDLGVTYQFCNFPMRETMELFGREVLPHLGVA